MKYSALLLSLLLAGCATQPTVKSWMDPKSSVTITAQTEPLVLVRAAPAPSMNERDYAQLTAIEVNRMGERKLYLVAILWNSGDLWSDKSGSSQSAFDQIDVNVGERTVALTPHTGEVSELGINQALPLPIPGSKHIYFPISRDDLRAISRSNRIELTARGVPEAPRRYEEWQDGRRSLNDFLGQLPELNQPQS
ncbi:hypothetical protein [Steroidobacter cummioxidans]|uniref:hypothetical protein n=1 Tax=Steroidobacter cummioxidans TaxID=1803913 RepID=UPI000E323E75|nr:hypothetical protein [Steroidobacter cummioxidans]